MKVNVNTLKIGDKFKWGGHFGEVINFDGITDFMKKKYNNIKNDVVWVKMVGYINGVDKSEFEGFKDGEMVELIASGPEPRNNDGRAICFWCNINTQKRGGGLYDVCPKCGR